MKKAIDKIVELFCIGIMSLMTILVSWQVFTRYVFNKPSAVTGQLSQYLFVWLVLYGAAYVFGKREHMSIVYLQDKSSPKIKFIIIVIQELIIAIFTIGVMVYGGYISTVKQMAQIDAALQVSVGLIYSAIPISGLLIMFYTYNNIREIIRNKEGDN